MKIIYLTKNPVRHLLDDGRKEFLSKYLSDLSKAIATVGLASNFFASLEIWVKMLLVFVAIIFLFTAIWLQPPKGD